MNKKLRDLFFVFILVLSIAILGLSGIVYAQSVGSWNDEDHKSWHSAEEIIVKVGENLYSLQNVVDGKMDSGNIWVKDENLNSHYAENIKVKIGERYFSLQNVVKYGLYALINPLASVGDSDEEEEIIESGPKTFTIQKGSSGYWKKICTTREGYTPETGRRHVEYTRKIGSLDIAEGKHKITCNYENGEDQIHELELKEEYELIAEGVEKTVMWVTDVEKDYNAGEGVINNPLSKDKYSYYVKIKDDSLNVRIYIEDSPNCPIYNVKGGLGYKSLDIKNFGEVKCTLEKI